jgi:cobalt-zinc-cadmium efflux system membrane fusion protein
MPTQPLHSLIQFLRRTAAPGDAAGVSDAELLERFLQRHDQAAFELLVWRYAPLVLGVGRRVLRDAGDIEDTFQASFLILARGAHSIGRRASLAAWLHKAAYRVALAAQARAARRARHEQPLDGLPVPSRDPDPAEEVAGRELGRVLDEQLDRLPEKYRAVFVLRCLAGKSSAEAARELGCPVGTVESRLTRARARLRAALARRGLAFPASGLALAVTEETALAARVAGTSRAALRFAAGQSSGGAAATGLAKGVLQAMFLTRLKVVAALAVVGMIVAAGAGLVAGLGADGRPPSAVPELLPARGDGLRLPPEWLARLGIRAAVVKGRRAAAPRLLQLTGVLSYDPDRLFSIRSRFAGEVTELGREGNRPLRLGDRVRPGQLLAVVWCKDLGEKKAALFDALVELDLQQKQLASLTKPYQEGALPLSAYRQAERAVQGSLNVARTAERTLKMWKLTDAEIAEIRQEAKRVPQGQRPGDLGQRWAKVEVPVPPGGGGTIVERNVNVGDVVDPASPPLFIIADLSRLRVEVHASAADVAALRALPEGQRQWVVHSQADSKVSGQGRIESIAPALDPKTQTAPVRGSVENREGLLLAGLFVTATVTLPPQSGEVVIPAAALVEDGKQTFVFVQPDPKEFRYEPRRVQVVRRGQDVAHVRARPGAGFDALRPGERVVTSGAVEMQAILADLQRRNRP